MKFYVAVCEENTTNSFTDTVEATTEESALESVTRQVLEGYLSTPPKHVGNPEHVLINITANPNLVGKTWRLSLKDQVATPCLECNGVGGVDSGGMTPWGSGISVPCPSCKPFNREQVFAAVDASTVRISAMSPDERTALREEVERAKADRNKAALEERQKYLPKLKELTDALNNLQDQVWSSLGKYSKTLAWGLTGIQPECWALLDTAIDDLAARRKKDAEAAGKPRCRGCGGPLQPSDKDFDNYCEQCAEKGVRYD